MTAAGGSTSVAVVDYGSGNLRSVAKAFERVASERGPGTDVVVTSDPAVVRRAGRIVLPGVGAFADCRGGLYGLPGMVEALTDAVIGQGTPFLGICVGMQLMAERGLEHVVSDGLGWIGGEVKLMTPAPAPDGLPLKVPHMGWNRLNLLQPEHPLLKGIEEGAFVYYVHSYLFDVADRADLVAVSDYGGEIAAVVGRKNYFGTQFHPEKSQANGLAFIRNFLDWRP
ncbi:imidazole glycerol phosphate synthase subunit HisH [Nisaea sediminum]|uniref:imidazole glycerol phosphate synthase subunit HisH n=1 Tax=Nisaea sediminum TaxID=2775867 RepID=UPI001868EC96|nr:imidazole glycerol phosphate synthase subunit HisH [Nisaea sediminum]